MSDKTTNEDRGSISDKRNNTSQSLGKKIVVAIACIGVCAYVVWNILSSPEEKKDTAKPHKKQEKSFRNTLAPLEILPPPRVQKWRP
ncbi:hypothetical protein MNL04_07055 [Bartonella krasnovii]|nr:hypothetical protein [Bartonella krasnovii]UNF48449.1 hypothetical protein MNL04_07055 [Bartonella krasnovii]